MQPSAPVPWPVQPTPPRESDCRLAGWSATSFGLIGQSLQAGQPKVLPDCNGGVEDQYRPSATSIVPQQIVSVAKEPLASPSEPGPLASLEEMSLTDEPRKDGALANQLADYQVTATVVDDGAATCLRGIRPARLGEGKVTIWALGPLARTPWTSARERLLGIATVRGPHLPDWLEAGTGEWRERSVVWVSAQTSVAATLAGPPPELDVPGRLKAVAAAARGAHALHEAGHLHGAICPQAVALLTGPVDAAGSVARAPSLSEPGTAVLAPPSLADGGQLIAQVGGPSLSFIDPRLLRGEGGRWSDIWALGATALYAATGSAPAPGLDDLPVVQALAQLLVGPAPAPPNVPRAIADVVSACLASDPARRPATAEQLADRLEEAAARW